MARGKQPKAIFTVQASNIYPFVIKLCYIKCFYFYTHDSVICCNIAITMVGMLCVLGTKVTSIATLLLYTQWGEPQVTSMVTWGETEATSMVTLPQPIRVCYVVMIPLVMEPALVMEYVVFHSVSVTRPWLWSMWHSTASL